MGFRGLLLSLWTPVTAASARRRRSTRRVAGGAVGLLLLVSGCQGAAQERREEAAPAETTSTPVAQPARVTVSPADGARKVRPDLAPAVAVTGGTLVGVVVRDPDGGTLPGRMTADGTRWAASGTLLPGTTYRARVTARATDGTQTTTSTSFTTLTPTHPLTTSISPLDGQTIGVGMPLVVRLSEDVTDRAAVERALTVRTTPAVEGSWSWIDDGELQWRPRTYWPAGTDIELGVGLTGVHAGGRVWGDETRTLRLRTGDAMVSVVDVKAKTMTVSRNGEVQRTIPVTTGKAGFRTRGGIKVISEKYETKVMDAATTGTDPDDPEYYRLEVDYAMRLTWSGEFLHAAPWSAGQQGAENVSHGCVGMSTEDARWLFEQSQVGDVVEVVASSRELEPGNGYTAWNVDWADWVAGSAL